MKTFSVLLLAAVLACSCGGSDVTEERFTVETMNKITPVKDLGRGDTGWLCAMLATIESDRLMIGDSVNLSPYYVLRRLLADRAERSYLSGASVPVDAGGTAPMALDVIWQYGVMPYDAYRSDCDFSVVCRKLDAVVTASGRRRTGLARLRKTVAGILDDSVSPVPPHVWLYSVEYTPGQLAASMFSVGDYIAATSYTHAPFGEDVAMCLHGRGRDGKYDNVPIDSLVERVERALCSGCGVCWEGCIDDGGFSFERGVARLERGDDGVTQESRQRAFESLETVPDHCMELVGTARDASGRRYFVCKNSWGTDNPYGGLMYMSVGYFRKNTVAVVMRKDFFR